ncbi:hypothetical protein HK098_004571 [Nowakowskiella sp. JEL0407]|nr:hypothetical protein HK098_004571 [Nowakowskiella sp. JEL0407]
MIGSDRVKLENLPVEVLNVIVSFLSSNVKSLYQLRLASKRFCELLDADRFSSFYFLFTSSKIPQLAQTLQNNQKLFEKFKTFCKELDFGLQLTDAKRQSEAVEPSKLLVPCDNLISLTINVFETVQYSIANPELFTPISTQITVAYPLLNELSIRSISYCDTTLIDLADTFKTLVNPQKLQISFCKVTMSNSSCKSALSIGLRNLQKLRSFSVTFDFFGFRSDHRHLDLEGVFESLQQLPMLTELAIRNTDLSLELTSKSLNRLLDCDRLETFSIRETIVHESTIQTIRSCKSLREVNISNIIYRQGQLLHLLLGYSPSQPDFQPEKIEIIMALTDFRNYLFQIHFERLKSLKFELINCQRTPESFDNLLEQLKSCLTLTNLDVMIPAKSMRRLNELLHALTNLKSLSVRIHASVLEGTITQEINGMLSTPQQSLTELQLFYYGIESDFDLICKLMAINATLSAISLGTALDGAMIDRVHQALHECNLNPCSRLKSILFVKFRSSPNPTEFSSIGSGKWRLRIGYSHVPETEMLFAAVYRLWKEGSFTISYIYCTDSDGERLRSFAEKYEHVEAGLIHGNWAIWYKKSVV